MRITEFNLDPGRDILVDSRPLIAHVLHRFDVGGMESGVVHLINHLPENRFRHVVIALTQVTDFRRRVRREDVAYFALGQESGWGIGVAPRLSRLFRQLRPSLVHSRDLAALEAALPAWWTGVPVRVHGEHGWQMSEAEGSCWKHRLTRRLYRPFVSHYIAASKHFERYLDDRVGVRGAQVSQIYSGVDTYQFMPARLLRQDVRQWPQGSPFHDEPGKRLWVIGTVGRLHPMKDQLTLAHAFVRALHASAQARQLMRWVVVGAGPMLDPVRQVLLQGGVLDRVWFAGERNDVPQLMRALDVLVLPSLLEGASNTLLEAMASAVPVVATAVGGNVELVEDGQTGRLVPPRQPDALARVLLDYFADRTRARVHGDRARNRVVEHFGLERMITQYATLYERLLARGDMLRSITTIRPPTVHLAQQARNTHESGHVQRR
ncbi:MAG TPA: TIGR03088 family PEP-CTERM/XrtA system glycosyltransferase [Burkholderiaceae bacterium]|nr:TIGR03088 family PEP-CTERM/XrtA system glycosyltransferase [Burkholderiaceae bacterium]